MTENNIKLVKVPADITRLFHSLDLTVNGAIKAYLKKRFTAWYSRCIIQDLDSGKGVDNIDIQLTMSVLKPLHANWKNDLYNYFTAQKERKLQPTAGRLHISDALKKGKQGLDPLDPFASIDPVSDESEPIDFAVQSNEEVDHFFASADQHHDEDDDGSMKMKSLFKTFLN